jgi:hypothetical protein
MKVAVVNTGAGSELTDSDGIEELLVGEDPKAAHQVVVEEGQQNVSRPVQERPGLEKDEEKPTQGEGISSRCYGGEPAPTPQRDQ